ncbi:hypothetical protein NGM44_00360 [Moraxella sp. FZFQ2102]|uniref:hypothetical protein n=1 Tax=Moraxella sp. FZFQ2102 TaxID=2953752 RepID=UPI00209BDF0C|nr:hypothetical protein [Moraxella sp. FZFQ2102]USZ14890.1 hypothetical protein NGM44_00360 [Moraxella sp. FZFQ2102]
MLKPAIIALALLIATSPALAKAQKLPFVGTRYFNFAGGMGTEESITITKKGNVTIKLYGKSAIGVLYKGKYQNPIPIDGGAYYYQIKGSQIHMLDENKKLEYACHGFGLVNPDSEACIAHLSKP